MVAPGVRVNSGARAETSVPGPTKRVTELLLMIGLVVITAFGSVQLSISASALRASSRMQEEMIILTRKYKITCFAFIFLFFLTVKV